MKILTNQRFELLALLLCTSVYFVWFAQPLMTAGADNARLVAAVFLDEGISLEVIRNTLNQDTLLLQRRDYGHLYFNMALVPLYIVNQFAPVTDTHILMTLRLVAAVFGAATVVAVFVLARRYFGSLVAWSAALLTATLPLAFLRYSLLARADTTQLFFLVTTAYFTCRLAEDGKQKWLIWASLAAGMACAAKYSGLFFLAILWLVVAVLIVSRRSTPATLVSTPLFLRLLRLGALFAGSVALLAALLATPGTVARLFTSDGDLAPRAEAALVILRSGATVLGLLLVALGSLQPLWRRLQAADWTNHLNRLTHQVGLSTLIFGAVYVLTAPALFIRFEFIRTLVYQVSSKTHGLDFPAEEGGLTWLTILATPPLLTGLLMALAVISLGWYLYDARRAGWQLLLQPATILWLWVALHMGLLIVAIRHFGPQYVLPAVPFLIILALQPLHKLAQLLEGRLPPARVQLVVGGTLALILALALPSALMRVTDYRHATMHPEELDRVQIGMWLAERYPESTRIAYDYYFPLSVPPAFEYVVTTYVPPKFADVLTITERDLPVLQANTPPDVVIVEKTLAERFTDIQLADVYYYGPAGFARFHDHHQALREERYGYQLVHTFANFEIYEACAATGCQGVSQAD